MDIFLIGLGGFIGAISRFVVVESVGKRTSSPFPFGTLTVNLIGSFLLGFLYGTKLNHHVTAMLGAGFLGAFTTFSTFQYENVQLGKKKNWKTVFLYVGVSVIAGILLAALGFFLGNELKK
ncbi:fluoride efflux transporter CrcB [Aneurinibacillus terranovensis]|uniref:fluoride efflux transporter CrcB n=1 Tax=Aneurinibacillus terranovensis TaxID=278991 RepID=UPI00040A4696|nr:fluoride efflux transporter CrcB [Aneurinibacillus terranovensis]